MTARFVTAAALAGIVMLGVAARAQAQLESSVPELRPTRGPQITGAVRAGDADATALELNPGLMGLLPAGSLQLVGSVAGEGAVIPRRGAGLYWATPIFGGSSIGLALSRVASAGAAGIDGHTNFRLGYALRIGRSFALGAAWAHQWGGLYTGTDTLDLGLAFRVGRYVAFGAVVEDVPAPNRLRCWCCRGCGPPSWRCARRAPTAWSWRSARRTPKATPGAGWCRARVCGGW